MERIKILKDDNAGSELLSVKNNGGLLPDTFILSEDHMLLRGRLSDALHFASGELVDVKTDLVPNSEKMTITVNAGTFELKCNDRVPYYPVNYLRRTKVGYIVYQGERCYIQGTEGARYITYNGTTIPVVIEGPTYEDYIKRINNVTELDGTIELYTEERPLAVMEIEGAEEPFSILYEDKTINTGEDVVAFLNTNEKPELAPGDVVAMRVPQYPETCTVSDGKINLNGVEYDVISNLKYTTVVTENGIDEEVRIKPVYSGTSIIYYVSIDGTKRFALIDKNDPTRVKRLTSTGSTTDVTVSADTTVVTSVTGTVKTYRGVVIGGVEYFELEPGYITVMTDLAYGVVSDVSLNRVTFTLFDPSNTFSVIHYIYKIGSPFYKLGKTDEAILTAIKGSLVIHHNYGGYALPLMAANTLATNMNQEDLVPNVLFEDVKDRILNEKRNRIIDMERDIYVPGFLRSYPTDPDEPAQGLDNVLEVRFNLHFRTRNLDTWEVIEDDKSPESIGKCNWFITDYYLPPEEMLCKTNKGGTNTLCESYGIKMLRSSDLLGFAGFEDDDIKYRKQRLSKSFLRLYFYDSPDPSQQSLLWQSTIFVDENQLYSEYVRNNNSEKHFVNAVNGVDFQVRHLSDTEKKLSGTTSNDYNYSGYLILRNHCEGSFLSGTAAEFWLKLVDNTKMVFNIGDNLYIEQFATAGKKIFVYQITDIDGTSIKVKQMSRGVKGTTVDTFATSNAFDIFLCQYAGNDFNLEGFDHSLSVFDEEITTYTVDENYGTGAQALNVNYYVPSFDERNRLTSRLSAFNRLASRRSSEGFYLQLFKEYSSHMHPRTIYMKAEFNHAGYGKRVPLMRMMSNGKEIESISEITPAMKAGFSVQETYENMFIPIKVVYDNERGRYTYYYEGNTSKVMTFNLFEVKFKTVPTEEGMPVTRKVDKSMLTYTRSKKKEEGSSTTVKKIDNASSFYIYDNVNNVKVEFDPQFAGYVKDVTYSSNERSAAFEASLPAGATVHWVENMRTTAATSVQVSLKDDITDLDLATVQTFQKAIRKVSGIGTEQENEEFLGVSITDKAGGFDLYRKATEDEIADSSVTKYWDNDGEYLSQQIIDEYYGGSAEMMTDDKAYVLFSSDTQIMEYVVGGDGATLFGDVITGYKNWEFSDIEYFGDGGSGWLTAEYLEHNKENIKITVQENLYGGVRVASLTLKKVGGDSEKHSARIRIRQEANNEYYSVVYNNKVLLQGERNITFKPQMEAEGAVGILSIVCSDNKSLDLITKTPSTGTPSIDIIGMPGVEGDDKVLLNGEPVLYDRTNERIKVDLVVKLSASTADMTGKTENCVKISMRNDGEDTGSSIYKDTVMFYKQQQTKKSVNIIPKAEKDLQAVNTGTRITLNKVPKRR